MRLHRFYINQELGKGGVAHVENPELLHQWQKVFRMQVADRVILFNGNGKEYDGFFELVSKKEARIVIENERKPVSILKTELHIFQSVIKKDNFELVVEKCTELGARAFHSVIAERSEKKDLNIERLKKIAVEAAEQSGKVFIPEIFEPTNLASAIESFDGKLFALDFGAEIFSNVFEKISARPIGLLVGPEGGWTDAERALFKKHKVESVSLGAQVLRAETAAIAASSLILLS